MYASLFSSRFGFHVRLIIRALFLSSVVLGVLLEASLGFSIAHADSGQADFALKPVTYDPSNPVTASYFIFDSKPGTIVRSQVNVTNTGTVKGTADLYAVDATTGQTSGAVYLNQNDPRRDVGAWITVSTRQLTLNPGQSQIVQYQINIPFAIRSGQHLGGIVAENAAQQTTTQNQNGGTFQVRVKSLTIVAVQVNLPGIPIEQLVGTGIKAGGQNGYQQLFIGLSNKGTDMLKPSGTLQVTDAQGHVVEKANLKLDTFLPQTSINYPVTISGQALGPGDYQGMVVLNYGNGQVLNYTTSFTIAQQQVDQVFTATKTQAPASSLSASISSLPPLWLLGTGGFIILVIVGGGLYWLGARSRTPKPEPTRFSQFKRPGMY